MNVHWERLLLVPKMIRTTVVFNVETSAFTIFYKKT